jgi:hypothetical protein
MSISTLATRSRDVAAKLETTQGTAISISGTDGTLPVFDPKMKYTVPIAQRPSPGSASRMKGIPEARSGEFTGQSHVFNAGTGTDPIWASTWLAACGMVAGSGGVYSYVTGSASANTLTMGLYQAGRLKKIAGAAGTAVIKGKAGSPLTIDWRFLGKYVAPSATALITPTRSTVLPPRFAGATITIGGTAYKVNEFTLDLGNTLTLVPDAGDASGYCWCVTDQREPTLEVKIMGVSYGTYDFNADFLAGTEVAFSCAVGSGSNNIVTIAAPKLQHMEHPDDEDNAGYVQDTFKFQLNQNSALGDDELTLTFS